MVEPEVWHRAVDKMSNCVLCEDRVLLELSRMVTVFVLFFCVCGTFCDMLSYD